MNKTNSLAAFAAGVFLSVATPGIAGDAEANALLVEAVQLAQTAEQYEDPVEKLAALNDAVSKLEQIVSQHPSSGLAVSLATGQTIGTLNPAQLRQQRDALDAEVQALLSEQQAIADAEAVETRWINKTMECVEDIDCARTMFVRVSENHGHTPERISHSLAHFELLQNGYSRAFDRQVKDILSAAGDNEAQVRTGLGFEYMVSIGIFHEKPKTVFQKMSSLVQKPDSLEPAVRALTIGLPERADDYLRLLVHEGAIEDFETARNTVYGNRLGGYGEANFVELQKLKADYENSVEMEDYAKEDLLNYLRVTGDPAFLEVYNDVKDTLGETAIEEMIAYQFITDAPSDAARYVAELDPIRLAQGRVYQYSGYTIPRKSRATRSVLKELTKSSLLAKKSRGPQNEDEEAISERVIDERTANDLLFVSVALQ